MTEAARSKHGEAAGTSKALLSRQSSSRNPLRTSSLLGLGPRRLIDPKAPAPPVRPDPSGVPTIVVADPKVIALFDALPLGSTSSTATLHLGPTIRRPVKHRNVAGLLRGSDPSLKDTCVMVTAHYDHVGVQRSPKGPTGSTTGQMTTAAAPVGLRWSRSRRPSPCSRSGRSGASSSSPSSAKRRACSAPATMARTRSFRSRRPSPT